MCILLIFFAKPNSTKKLVLFRSTLDYIRYRTCETTTELMGSFNLAMATLFCMVFWLRTPALDTAAVRDDDMIYSPGSVNYVEYHPSSGLNVILSAPHGGNLAPESIPDRDAGCWNNETQSCTWSHTCGTKDFTRCKAVTVTDIYTMELTTELRSRLCGLFHGICPAAILNLLQRVKFDGNRDLEEGTFGVGEVVSAFHRYHKLIDLEKQKIQQGGIGGLFIDVHGHGHKTQWAELGYLPRGVALNSGISIAPNETSIRALGERIKGNFDQLLRGNVSFGAYLAAFGFNSVPSPRNRGPGNETYFNGGYNTRRHGSHRNGSIDAIQIESARSPRDPDMRPSYVKALACTIRAYYCRYYYRENPVSDLSSQSLLSAACKTHEGSECDEVAREHDAAAGDSNSSNGDSRLAVNYCLVPVICIFGAVLSYLHI